MEEEKGFFSDFLNDGDTADNIDGVHEAVMENFLSGGGGGSGSGNIGDGGSGGCDGDGIGGVGIAGNNLFNDLFENTGNHVHNDSNGEEWEIEEDEGNDGDVEQDDTELGLACGRLYRSNKRAKYYINNKEKVRTLWDRALGPLREGHIRTFSPHEPCVYCAAKDKSELAVYRCYDCGGGDHPIGMCEECHIVNHSPGSMLALHRWQFFMTPPDGLEDGNKCWVTRPTPSESIRLDCPLTCKCDGDAIECTRARHNFEIYTRHGSYTHTHFRWKWRWRWIGLDEERPPTNQHSAL